MNNNISVYFHINNVNNYLHIININTYLNIHNIKIYLFSLFMTINDINKKD